MSSSRKKKTSKQLKTYLAILAPILGVLLLLAVILTFGKFAATPPEDAQTDPAPNLQEDPPETTDFAYQIITPTDPAEEARVGIDISEHQQSVDWELVKAAGIDFVMIRIGYRGYTQGRLYIDSRFDQHIRGAQKAGLDVGVYFFSQAITPSEARQEARFLLMVLNWRRLDLGIAYDWEFVNSQARTAGMDGRTMTDCALAFCETIAAAGQTPLVYFNQYQADNYYILDDLTQYDFWFAKYADEMTCPYPVKMWQYTESGTVPGIAGPVDMNLYWP